MSFATKRFGNPADSAVSNYAAAGTDDQNIWIGGGGKNSSGAGAQGSSNVSVGYLALDANTTGAYNTAVGHDAMPANTTGVDNTAIGQAAMLSNVSGISNTAVGVQALELCVAGNNNTAVGLNALQKMTSNGGTAVGEEAGRDTTAAQGTFLGMEAGRLATTGAANTLLGFRAGDAIIGGANNTIVGANYPASAAISNAVVLTDGAGNVRFQDLAGATTLPGSVQINGNVGFGGTAPIAKPSVTGSRGGNAALASLMTALANLGLITNNTTA